MTVTWSNGAGPTSGADVFTGDENGNTASGLDGNDIMSGAEGSDTLYGNGGHDRLFGDAGNDALTGGSGDDILDGGAGFDTMSGGNGDDTYFVDMYGEAREASDPGVDTVKTTTAVFFLALSPGIENVTFIGAGDFAMDNGNALDNEIRGGAGNDTLYAGVGTDTLFGGAGNDSLDRLGADDSAYGGAGDDDYFVHDANAVIGEAAGGGNDLVVSYVSTWTLGENFEWLSFGNVEDVTGIGNALNNEIVGTNGNDTLTGGLGADYLLGGYGDDIFRLSSGDITGDAIQGGDGNGVVDDGERNTVAISGDIDFSDAFYVQNITDLVFEGAGVARNLGVNFITGSSGVNQYAFGQISAAADFSGLQFFNWTAEDRVTLEISLFGTGVTVIGTVVADEMRVVGSMASLDGDDGDDQLFGGIVNDILSGGQGADTLDGGQGEDAMTGGDGDDIYIVDSVSDQTTETSAAGGADAVQTSITRTLSVYLENLVLTGAGAINGTGNGGANIIVGNSAVNTLTGGASNDILIGGASADVLNGDSGNDTASYDNSAARVRINLTTGAALDADAQGDTYTSIERLTGSDFNDQLTGSSIGNVLMGGKGVDILDGRGGQDLLIGGANNDVFVFSSGLGAADTIDDFAVGADKIRLENNIFTGLAAGALAASAFNTGAAASDASDRVIYNSATGFVYFDRDGTGAQSAIHFATLDAGLAMSAADFAVV